MPTAPAPSPSLGSWQRTIEPTKSNLDPSAARALLELRLSAKDLRRADHLASRAAARTLTESEAQEVESYRNIGTALEFLKSKARLVLAAKG